MKRWTALGLAVLLVLPAAARADTTTMLQDVVKKAAGALAVVRYEIDLETGKRVAMGQGICITQDGVFLTTSLDPRLPVKSLKGFQLILPGLKGKEVKAKLLGIDPWTGLGFVKATEPHTWQVVQFSSASNVSLGQPVASIGIMMGDPARPVYLGTAHVSAKLRVPGELVYVTGGRLTGTCSPVFTTGGQAIGIVGRQLSLGYQAQLLGLTRNRKAIPVGLRMQSSQETAFFTPVEEFVHVLRTPPSDGSVARLPWMGVNKFEAVNKELADALKLDKPAVKVEDVIPNQPAAKGGLANNDIIVGFNGKPIEEMATPELSVRNFVRSLMRMNAGDQVKLKLFSGKEVTVTLGDMPKRPSEAKRYYNRAIGLLVREKVMLDQYLDKGETANVPGLIVLGMARGSAAAAAGLQGGDVITNVSNQPVKTCDVFQQIVEKSLATSQTAPINFLVRRGEQAQVITVKPAGGS